MADQRKTEAFGRLLDIMDDLREKCPWDRKQTMETLRSLSIEELYELADAILDEDLEGVKEELGDLMLHMVFYAKIGEEKGAFDIADALHHVCDKLVRRHPHIYGDIKVEDAEEVKQNWEKIKLQEGKKSVLAGVPRSLPSMIKALRLQQKTAQVGFEWEKTEDVWKKVEEEIGELQDAVKEGDITNIEDEFGDVLFSLINYSRFIGVDPETALERVNTKFKNRFEHIEKSAKKPLQEMTLQEMDALWEDAK